MLENALSLLNFTEIIQVVEKLLGQNTQYANVKKKKRAPQSQQASILEKLFMISISKMGNPNFSAYIILRKLKTGSTEISNHVIQ